ncbi:MAG: EAL domain-containing protein, partial [Proteobacteria bacterium]|nr:EAL domain-containing protein [Pseudomonadota bacterium]
MFVNTISLGTGEVPRNADFESSKQYPEILIQVFSATEDLQHLQTVLDKIAEYLPDATIIGASSDETIDTATIRGNDYITLSVLGFTSTTLQLAYSENQEDSKITGYHLAEQTVRSDTRLLISFCDASSINGEQFIDGISEYREDLLIAGGIAATPTFTDTFIIVGTKIIPHGAVILSLNSDQLEVYRDNSFGWQPVGQQFTITRSSGNLVESISEQTPLSLFRHYLGKRVVDSLPGIGSAFPLIIKRDEFMFARGIIGLDGESFIVSGNVENGDSVFIGYGNPSTILEQNNLPENIINNIGTPDVILSYYCEGRKLFLPRNVVEYEIESLSNVAPYCGFFTLGEFYTSHKQHRFLNFSSTIIALKETNTIQPSASTKTLTTPAPDFFEIVSEGLFNFIDVRSKELSHIAFHDELTSLPNRNYFTGKLHDTIEKAKARGQKLALLFIGINELKDINDMFGYSYGDELLKNISDRLKDELGSNDTLVRFNDDEFVQLIECASTCRGVKDVAENILDKLRQPIQIEPQESYVTASIGISQYPQDGHKADDLIKNAHTARNILQDKCENCYQFFTEGMQESLIKRKFIEQGLRSAINNDEFVIYYQPKINIETRKIIGAEALIRWQHPQQGLINPSDFISIAEKTGLILEIGDWVLATACQQAKEWIRQYSKDFRIAVNLSARQLEKRTLAVEIIKTLDEVGLDTQSLELEITESMIMKDLDRMSGNFRTFNNAGITLSLDDFGTGYSSLTYLKQLKISHLKIDRSFVNDLIDNSDDQSITSAIISMGHKLGITVIAEGVENAEQLELLEAFDCDEVQGYYFSRPVTADKFTQLLESEL